MHIATRFSIISLLSLLIIITGCNIYDWTASDDSTADIVAEGRKLMRDGDYQGAFELFEEALIDDPDNSLLRYLHAKAAIRRTGVSTIALATEITSVQTFELRADLPFMDRTTWPDSRSDSLYKGIHTVLGDLRPILSGATHGDIDSTDIRLDMTVGTAVNALLRFRDTNGDSTILSPPDINLNIFFSRDQLHPDSLANMDPGEINDLLDQLDTLLEEGLDNLLDILGEDNGISEDSLLNVLDKLRGGKELYRVHDGKDNDGDWVSFLHDLDNNGEPSADWDGPLADANGDGNPLYDPEPQVDEEALDGIDNDGDGLTDEDSHITPNGG